MVKPFLSRWLVVGWMLGLVGHIHAQQVGSISGVVYDADFDVPLAAANVEIAETGQTVTGTDQGTYVFSEVEPGTYTLVFTKDGYERVVEPNVVVQPGQLETVDVYLGGDFTDMDEFVVQDLAIAAGTEQEILEIRFEAPSILDGISSELLERSGQSDVAGALTLVSGTTVQDGKFAVIRGLPDRYVNSQINSVRLPTADADKRAVQLDQFPTDVVESIQVSKTFTPDQQGDASGGAVNVILKSIPRQPVIKFGIGTEVNTNVLENREEFLSYRDGGTGFFGTRANERQPQPVGTNWDGAVGVTETDAPWEWDWNFALGGSTEVQPGMRVGGFVNFYWERDASFHNNGIDDSWWVQSPGGAMVPRTTQGSPSPGTPQTGDFRTSLFDVTEATEQVQWGGLATVGIEIENHRLNVAYLFTHVTEDTATLAEDTRSKEYFFPGYDVNDPLDPGNRPDIGADAAPYIRTQTLTYQERETATFQLSGEHRLAFWEIEDDQLDTWEGFFRLLDPVVDWTFARSSADSVEPDKRQFGAVWRPDRTRPGIPPNGPPFFIPPQNLAAEYRPFKPAANFTLGNAQRTFQDIVEKSTQYFINFEIPFQQWTGDRGYVKLGVFDDSVERSFNQESFSNFNDNAAAYQAQWDEFWSDVWENENHPITAGPPFVDVDYEGDQEISAWYWMVDLPIESHLNIIGGIRYETTRLSIINDPEANATWFPPGATGPVVLNPGDADVFFEQDDLLPAIGFKLEPIDGLIFRGSYTETVARQTFKELTPIQQQEFLGGDVFIGNPELEMSSLENFDLRLDWTPYPGGLISVSWFYKDVTNPIENVQRLAGFTFTTPVNYPEGELSGWEFEIRQDLGHFWQPLKGLSVGANATLIDSEVRLTDEEIAVFASPAIQSPMTHRDMTNAPEYLYNINLTYDLEETGTRLGLFYTVRGDTLVAGAAAASGNFVPSVYEKEFDTLNFSLIQNIGKHIKVKFQAKNLTDPLIQEVYRSQYIGDDVLKTSYSKGIDFSIGISANFTF